MIYTDGTPTIVSQGVKAYCACWYDESVTECKCKEVEVEEYGIYDSEA